MKITSLMLTLLMSVVSLNVSANSLPPWNKSPQLEALIVEFKQQYHSEHLSDFRQKQMSKVNNLSYFIRFIDK
ncbi:hypothetical protein AB6E85_21445, partial [Vibrio sp. 10N.247.311.51]